MDEQTDQYIMFMSATYIDDNFLPVILSTYILYPLLKESRKHVFHLFLIIFKASEMEQSSKMEGLPPSNFENSYFSITKKNPGH